MTPLQSTSSWTRSSKRNVLSLLPFTGRGRRKQPLPTSCPPSPAFGWLSGNRKEGSSRREGTLAAGTVVRYTWIAGPGARSISMGLATVSFKFISYFRRGEAQGRPRESAHARRSPFNSDPARGNAIRRLRREGASAALPFQPASAGRSFPPPRAWKDSKAGRLCLARVALPPPPGVLFFPGPCPEASEAGRRAEPLPTRSSHAAAAIVPSSHIFSFPKRNTLIFPNYIYIHI